MASILRIITTGLLFVAFIGAVIAALSTSDGWFIRESKSSIGSVTVTFFTNFGLLEGCLCQEYSESVFLFSTTNLQELEDSGKAAWSFYFISFFVAVAGAILSRVGKESKVWAFFAMVAAGACAVMSMIGWASFVGTFRDKVEDADDYDLDYMFYVGLVGFGLALTAFVCEFINMFTDKDSVLNKVTCGLLLLASAVFAVGLVTVKDGWYSEDFNLGTIDGTLRVGLWQACLCTESALEDAKIDDEGKAALGFLVISIFVGIATVIFGGLYASKKKESKAFAFITMGLAVAQGILVLIAWSTFFAGWNDSEIDERDEYDFNYAWYWGLFSWLFAFVGAVLCLLAMIYD